MDTVYLVTQGTYSDYRIVSAFSTREKAETFAALYNSDTGFQHREEMYVEAWALDTDEAQLQSGFKQYSVMMDAVTGADVTVMILPGYSPENQQFKLILDSREPRKWALGQVLARDREHAIKIANEKRLMLLAEEDIKGNT